MNQNYLLVSICLLALSNLIFIIKEITIPGLKKYPVLPKQVSTSPEGIGCRELPPYDYFEVIENGTVLCVASIEGVYDELESRVRKGEQDPVVEVGLISEADFHEYGDAPWDQPRSALSHRFKVRRSIDYMWMLSDLKEEATKQ